MDKILKVKCRCGGTLKATEEQAEFFGMDFGLQPAEICTRCGEVYFEQETLDKIEEQVKAKGLFGLEVRTCMTLRKGKLIIDTPKKISSLLGGKSSVPITMYPVSENRFEIEIRQVDSKGERCE